jgi:hypothetical protein
MKTILEHTFKTKCHDLQGLFQGVNTMNALMRNIERQAMIDPLRYDPLKYVGDAFEFFVELFLMLHPNDNRVGVYEYHPTQENDNGVDGIGNNILNQKSVVQVKYRSNTQGFLTNTEDHLSNMFSDGMLAHNVVADMDNPKNYRHFVFTTAKGLNFYTDAEMFKSKVRCFGNDDFRSLLNNNIVFWNNVREVINNI